MGYESKLIIVQKPVTHKGFESMETPGKFYAEKIAEFNLCKAYNFSNWMCEQPVTDSYFYADDGNTEVLEDRYGGELTEAPVQAVLDKLKECMAQDDYRRYKPIVALLEALMEDEDKWDELAVLHYGY